MSPFRLNAGWRRLLATVLLLTAPCLAAIAADAELARGEAIYRQGVLGSGQVLEGRRDAGLPLQAAAAACVNCHRRSGLGARQGRIVVPPVAARYLFHPRQGAGNDRDLPFVETMRADREPYTDATLGRAIREGIDSQGRTLGYLMPRFAISDTDLAALIAYLKKLNPVRARAASTTEIHFATIVTPDADPARRAGVLAVLEQFFADKNAVQRAPSPELHSSDKTAFAKMMLKIRPRWELHVWQLEGPAATWGRQLDKFLAAQPVFAVVSGVGGPNWAPVHDFCERSALPCLFPNIDAPPAEADHDFYSLYFSRGVLLEAELIAAAIAGGASPPTAVRQVYRSGDVGAAAAGVLAAALARQGIAVSDAPVPAVGAGLTEALASVRPEEAVVLWLRPSDLAALSGEPPPTVYSSGLMGGLERSPLPSAWRTNAHMAYPVDLPDRRRVRVDYAMGWFNLRHIPVVATQAQADTYLACGLVSETLSRMVDTFVRDYLVERVEDMLEHRLLTGYYPRLSLGQGQRFASKGGYMVRFAEATGVKVVAEDDWRVP
jgi:hypothetical protein